MRNPVLALIRLGPSAVYAFAAMLLISMVLLTNYPSSAWAWWLHMTMLPVMREPIALLLAVPGITFWSALAILTSAALLGTNLAFQPERHPKTGFIHAHIALIVTLLAVVRVTNVQAGLSGFSLPLMLRGDWSMLQIGDSLLGMALLGLVFLACLCSHIAMIRRICA